MTHPHMDLLPLIPGRDGSQNAARAIREVFQDILDGRLYPKKMAEYIVNCQADEELKIRETAEQVLQIYDGLNDFTEFIENAGREIMEQHGNYLIQKDHINSLQNLKECIRLQHCNLFKKLRLFNVDYFGLLQKSDLLPDAIKIYLDYRLNEGLHLCESCLNKVTEAGTPISASSPDVLGKTEPVARASCKSHEDSRRKRFKSAGKQITKKSLPEDISQETFDDDGRLIKKVQGRSPYIVMPHEVQFDNCEPGQTYKRTVKLINTSSIIQYLAIQIMPRAKGLTVTMERGTKLAAGMSCLVKIVYKPLVYRNIQDYVTFRNQFGCLMQLTIRAIRDPPKLDTCIFRANTYCMNRPEPGSSRFLETRREALNSSIDCGSCLVGEYIYLTLFIQNTGSRGKFFIITEEEWYSENIEKITTSLEYSGESVWIYPIYFELDTNQMIEISILFFPSKPDIYVEKFYFVCDNNSFQQLEVLGDGLMFNRKMLKIDVPPTDIEINEKEEYCIFFGIHPSYTCIPFTLTVHNSSALHLKGYWKLENKLVKDIKSMDQSWIEYEKKTTQLAPYSTTDFLFKINLNSTEEGCYNIFFNFLVADVPLMSLDREGTFLILLKRSNTNLSKCTDVHFMEMEVACSIENLMEEEEDVPYSESIISSEPTVSLPKMEFSTPFLEFGILPTGLCIQKLLWVNNLSVMRTKWRIVEVKYNPDFPPYMEILNSKNVSCSSGEFFCLCKREKIFYKVDTRDPVRWVSMLLLISFDEDTTHQIESLCVVTYEVINYHITINNEAVSPALFPMKAVYTGLPETLKVSIENRSPIRGMFYFFRPYGESTSSVHVKITPRFGVLEPFRSQMLEVNITCDEVGIFENVFVPCFVNKGQNCIILRILCAVDCVHMAMYLPGRGSHYQRIIWPPKILFEYDDNWMICPCTLEFAPDAEMDEMDHELLNDTGFKKALPSLNPDEHKLVSRGVEAAIGETLCDSKTTSKNSSSSSSSEEPFTNLKEKLQKEFGKDLFLQDYVVEVHNVPLKTPDLWNDMIMNEYGICVLPDVEEGGLDGFGFAEINITIFANTWGIYQEEIAVDISDVPCFTFSLLIEVSGCPVQVPMASTRITDLPVIRFGTLSYTAEDVERKIKVSNTSSIPLKVLWHCFLKSALQQKFNVIFDMITSEEELINAVTTLTDTYYGSETNSLFSIPSYESNFEGNSSNFIDIKMTPANMALKMDKTFVRSSVLGHIIIEERYRSKVNYFFRPTEFVKLEIHCSLELPLLTPDFFDEPTLRFYANDVILDPEYREGTRLVFLNNHSCATEILLDVKEPLQVLDRKGHAALNLERALAPQDYLEVKVICNITHQKILDLGQMVYPKEETNITLLMEELDVYDVNLDLRILQLKRDLTIMHRGGADQVFPINVFIYFPHISTKPTAIKLDQVLIANTRKSVVTVFNHTGCPVNFEIYKTMNTEELFITPHYGQIPKSTGVHKSFVNLFVYFTPREVRSYQESIRVVTNIPNYYIEVPIKATGTLNEKFYVDYKI